MIQINLPMPKTANRADFYFLQNGFLICKKSHNTSGGKWFCADGESNGQTDKTE